MKYLFLQDCLGINKVDRTYHVSGGDINPSTGKAYAINPSSGVWDDNYFAKNYGGASGGGSYPVPNFTLNDLGGSAMALANQSNGYENDALNKYTMASNSMQKPIDMYNEYESAAGLPQLRQTQQNLSGQVNDLTNTINAVEPNVNASTTNSLVTEAQRNGMVTAQKYPLQQILNPLSNNLGMVGQNINSQESNIGTKVGLGVEGEQMQLQPLQMGIQVAADNAARAMSGFTQDQQMNYNLLMSKVQAQQHLSDQDWQALQNLQEQKNQYNIAQMQTNAQLEQYKSLGKYGIYNPSTGQVISNGGGGAGGGGGSTGLFGGSSGGGYTLTP